MTRRRHDPKAMPLLAHLEELRRRLLYTLVVFALAWGVCYYFVYDLYQFLLAPLLKTSPAYAPQHLIYTGLTEAFFTYLKVSGYAGFSLSIPFLLWQVWRFVAPGLHRRERVPVWSFLVASPALFLGGAAMAYYIMFPLAWTFFLSFQNAGDAAGIPITLNARMSEYLSLSLKIIFAFGLCFQLPLVLMLLGRAGILTARTLRIYRRHAIVAIFFVAAFLTPPDVMSQILLALPVMILYEVSILLVRNVERRRA